MSRLVKTTFASRISKGSCVSFKGFETNKMPKDFGILAPFFVFAWCIWLGRKARIFPIQVKPS